MGPAISEVLPFAIGIAISPIPIIAVILMLFSTRARVNGPAFLAGWVVGLAVLSGVVYALTDSADASTDTGASDTVSWLRIVLGVLLLASAARNWRRRPGPGAEPKLPTWMADVEQITPVKAVALGVLLSSVNPKNLVLTIGAAAGLGQLGPSTSDAVVALAVFVGLSSATTAALIVYSFVGGQHAATQLDEFKQWLALHNTAVMAVIFLVFGVLLISKGLGLLTA